MIRVGLCAGFGASLRHEFAGIASYGFGTIRQDLYAGGDPAAVPALVAECAGAPCQMVFLIGGGSIMRPDGNRIEPHELAAWTTAVIQAATAAGVTHYALEIGNEPDIACAGYAEHPEDFSEAIRQCYDAARVAGFQGPLITGGISNLNRRGLRYLTAMLAAEELPGSDLVIGFHRYPEGGRGPLAPHDGFASREDEWRALRTIVGRLQPLACTELGYHTAPSNPVTLSDADVAEAVLWDLAFYEDRGVPLAVVYQLNDGPTETWIDRYGVRTTDGTWKVVADRIRETYGEG